MILTKNSKLYYLFMYGQKFSLSIKKKMSTGNVFEGIGYTPNPPHFNLSTLER